MRALICGVSGHDGTYLADLLLGKGYEVFGTSRDNQTASLANHDRIGIAGRVRFESMVTQDSRSVLEVLRNVEPHEVHDLAGQSFVGLSFDPPVEILDSIVAGSLNFLECIRFLGWRVRLYNAGSIECFGDTSDIPPNKPTPFRPRSPYAVAKAASFWLVANYREACGLDASTGILFNHESPLRSERFVTQKIVSTACRIFRGRTEKFVLGNIDIYRDWGWAPEYVEAMWNMRMPSGGDYVVATGETRSFRDFVETAFALLNLDWLEHTEISRELLRPTDIDVDRADPGKAAQVLGWCASSRMQQVVAALEEAELRR